MGLVFILRIYQYRINLFVARQIKIEKSIIFRNIDFIFIILL